MTSNENKIQRIRLTYRDEIDLSFGVALDRRVSPYEGKGTTFHSLETYGQQGMYLSTFLVSNPTATTLGAVDEQKRQRPTTIARA